MNEIVNEWENMVEDHQSKYKMSLASPSSSETGIQNLSKGYMFMLDTLHNSLAILQGLIVSRVNVLTGFHPYKYITRSIDNFLGKPILKSCQLTQHV